jgi:metal-responsive CopG/Arc/MetJ family transcriptional regulator
MSVKLVTVWLPETYLDALDALVGREVTPNHSEAIRVAIRDYMVRELKITDLLQGAGTE